MRHYGRDWRTKLRVALLITLTVECSMYGEVDAVRSLCRYMTPFSFSIQSSGKNRQWNWFESNLNFLYLFRVPACLEFPMV